MLQTREAVDDAFSNSVRKILGGWIRTFVNKGKHQEGLSGNTSIGFRRTASSLGLQTDLIGAREFRDFSNKTITVPRHSQDDPPSTVFIPEHLPQSKDVLGQGGLLNKGALPYAFHEFLFAYDAASVPYQES